jgi:hypothetical protein
MPTRRLDGNQRPSLSHRRPQPNRAERRQLASNKPPKVLGPPLLVERAEACRLLGGISRSMIIRLEAQGRVTPIKLDCSNNGKTFYALKELQALAAGGDDDRAA